MHNFMTVALKDTYLIRYHVLYYINYTVYLITTTLFKLIYVILKCNVNKVYLINMECI